ncbi:Thiol-specific monooxygenase [Candida viswanathii]|uniref:Thiol-specific monooxygenase n=1 Tax=Candida viswanathii TaxID=5486 RepID=A0A367XMP1_9ASCO|nr:Thiol-specific monooxygenase [Candida viswanathii]
MTILEDLDFENPVGVSSSQVKTVAIIGGGASGAIILDSLLKEPSGITQIVVFERQKKLGGVWIVNDETVPTPNDIVKAGSYDNDPQLDNPFHEADPDVRKLVLPKNKQERFIETPSYEGITTNIIEKLMTFSDTNRWDVEGDDDARRYVGGNVVQQYIEKYINKNLGDPRIDLRFGTTVEDVEKIERDDGAELPYRFRVTIRTAEDDEHDLWYQEEFDTVVVATGHYHVPFIPHVPGLRDVQEQFPEKIQHAKFYRSPSAYKGKTVIVVGARASGVDLSRCISKEPGTTVYQSIRNLETARFVFKSENLSTKPAIKEYQIDGSDVNVIFEDGTVIQNPDHIIYGTGYLFSYPFLNRLTNNKITERLIVPGLYQHTFLISEPLITIIGVPVDGISFRVFEYQSVLVARYLTGKIKLPSRSIQTEWAANRLEEKKNTRAYHTIGIVDALSYSQYLTRLGQVPDGVAVGRQFPVLKDGDILESKGSIEKLLKLWNEA